MTGTAFRFMILSVLMLLIGMVWGLQMGASEDHTHVPAHAHLNLVGGVLFAVFALFYHSVPAAAASGLARVHFPVALLGVAAMVPGIALHHTGGTEALVIAGSVITIASMAIFLVVVLRSKT